MAAKGMKGLQLWCKQNTDGYKDVNITNMTTSWKDGLAFCALLHRFRPDLIDFDALSKEDILHNNQLAFSIAEKELSIAALLDAEDMVAMKVPDKLSIMTYVSQYYNTLHKLKPSESTTVKRPAVPDKSKNVFKIQKTEVNNEKMKIVTPKPRGMLSEKTSAFILCEICGKRVHLVERYIDDGKIYHRQCHRQKSLGGMYRRGGSKAVNKFEIKSSNLVEKTLEKMDDFETDSVSKVSKSDQKPKKILPSDKEKIETPNESGENIKKDSPVKPTNNKLNNLNENNQSLPNDKSPSKKLENTKVVQPNQIDEDKDEPNENKELLDDSNFHKDASKTESDLKNNDSLNMEDNSLKSNITENIASNKGLSSSSESDNDTRKMLPSLLHSLAAAKQDKQQSEISFPSSENGLSPLSTAPLISELPKTQQTPKPVPSPRHFPSIVNKDLTEEKDLNKSLNPFDCDLDMTTDSIVIEDDRNEKSLNPFGEEIPEIKKGSTQYDDSLNPFGSESDSLEELNNDEIKQTRTVENSVKQKDATEKVNVNNDRLNPFSDEYEDKKEKAPKPPVRRVKGPAPLPPVNKENLSEKMSPQKKKQPLKALVPPENDNKIVSPRKKAPDWKSDVELKMKVLNTNNEADTKYIDKSKLKSIENSRENKSSNTKNLTSPAIANTKPKPSRLAPSFGFPLVKRRIKYEMTEEEIESEMTIVDIQLKDLEDKGVKLEEVLRIEMQPDKEWKNESDKLLADWFELVHDKNILVRRETGLVFLMQQQKLEQKHADVEFKIRKLLNKPDAEKSSDEKEEESKLLEELVKIVERRNTIINSIEEERVKEEEEDQAYDLMKKLNRSVPNESEHIKKKKKNKVKKMFSKRKKNPAQKTSNKQNLEQSSNPNLET